MRAGGGCDGGGGGFGLTEVEIPQVMAVVIGCRIARVTGVHSTSPRAAARAKRSAEMLPETPERARTQRILVGFTSRRLESSDNAIDASSLFFLTAFNLGNFTHVLNL